MGTYKIARDSIRLLKWLAYYDRCYYENIGYYDKIHLTENIILGLRNPPTSLRTQYQVQNETQIRKNQKVIKNDIDELMFKNYPKKKQPINQPKIKLAYCPSCKQNNWLEFDKGWWCQNCEYIIDKPKHQIDKKKFVDEIMIFLLDYHMLIKGL